MIPWCGSVAISTLLRLAAESGSHRVLLVRKAAARPIRQKSWYGSWCSNACTTSPMNKWSINYWIATAINASVACWMPQKVEKSAASILSASQPDQGKTPTPNSCWPLPVVIGRSRTGAIASEIPSLTKTAPRFAPKMARA